MNYSSLTSHHSSLFATVLVLTAVALPLPANAQLTAPSIFLGYELGDRFTPHHRVVDYVRHVADNAPGVVVEEYGRTYEDRPLLLAFVSSSQNIARLDDIRRSNLALAGLSDSVPGETAIVWLSYNVHGNESVSTEAAMQTLYELSDPGNQRAAEWLENTVVIIDPCINPDGRERYVQWYNRTAGAFVNPDPGDWTHDEPWPGGRTNHYYYDLNRDWAWASQTETRSRLAQYNAWMPHVHVDFHEQGINNPYYFAPAAEPFHEDITPWQRQFQTDIGRNHARYFDEFGWLYFTKQVFDLFYPGYGDTWPTYNGAVGMTYEQAGSGAAGLAVETATGDTLTLADRIAHHHTTGISTVEISAQNAGRLVEEFRNYFARARESTSGGFVIHASGLHDRVAALARLLGTQGIEYSFADRASTISGTAFLSGLTGRREVERGDVVVPLDQPKSTLAKVLLEREAALADSITYDITAWSLPLLYGLDATSTADIARIPLAEAGPDAATSPGVETPYAYVASFASVEDHRFLADLHRQRILVRMAHAPFTIDGTRFDRGSLVITRSGNRNLGSRFDAVVRQVAESHDRRLHTARSGFVDDGPDFGSSDVVPLETPRILLVGGESVSSSSFGQAWHYFDDRVHYPVTIVNADAIARTDLDDYNVMVLPSGSYGSTLNDERLDDLRSWVRGGGKLIALDAAARFLADKDGFGLKRRSDDDDDDADSLDIRPSDRPYAERERRDVSESLPGALFAADVDVTHPLAYGLSVTMPILRRSTSALEPLADGWNVAVLTDGRPISGFAGHDTAERLDGSLALAVEDMGRGTVVYLPDDPLFRSMWHAGILIFGNAVFAAGTD